MTLQWLYIITFNYFSNYPRWNSIKLLLKKWNSYLYHDGIIHMHIVMQTSISLQKGSAASRGKHANKPPVKNNSTVFTALSDTCMHTHTHTPDLKSLLNSLPSVWSWVQFLLPLMLPCPYGQKLVVWNNSADRHGIIQAQKKTGGAHWVKCECWRLQHFPGMMPD